MSGVVAFARREAPPEARRHMEALTQAMAFRGPDAQAWEMVSSAGLGHALLRTVYDRPPGRQPMRLEAPVWISADARIDAQPQLRKALRARGRHIPDQASDAELILHAYLSWGTQCVEHLLGDFCFAIWDARSGELFAARDPFGVKPFFWTPLPDGVLVGNTLDALRAHPEVRTDVDDSFMADFLLFGASLDPESSVWSKVRRLRAGHSLIWSAGQGVRLHRYWQLPDYEEGEARSDAETIEAFTDLLRTVVSDRLRTDRVGLEFSGGMDSTSLGAIAKECLQRQVGEASMQGVCVVYDHWLPDEERRYAGLAARHLDIPIRFLGAEQFRLLDFPDAPIPSPEPTDDWVPGQRHRVLNECAAFARVWLTGWDGDALFSEPLRPALAQMARHGDYLRLVRAVMSFLHWQGSLSLAGRLQRLRQRHPARQGDEPTPFPEWIHPDLVRRLDLRSRWEARPDEWHGGDKSSRPYAYGVLRQIANDGRTFEHYDAGMHGLPLEFRHPLLDLRLIAFCLKLPLQPWCLKKNILRRAMVGKLPKVILRRPKAPLPGSPWGSLLRRDAASLAPWPVDRAEMSRFVIFDKLIPWNEWRASGSVSKQTQIWQQNGRPWMMARWLSEHRNPPSY